MRPSVICIGASAGGVPAIQKLLAGFKEPVPVPIVIVQHIAHSTGIDLGMVFGQHYKGKLVEAIDKQTLEPGTVYFAPSSYHLLFEKDASLSLSQDEPVNFARPSIDVSMESAALSLGTKVMGVLLTGANSDGALGMKAIQDVGGYTIVQDPKTAEVSTMPQSALELIKPNRVTQLEQMADYITQLLGSDD